MTHAFFPFDPVCTTRPWRLFAHIAARVYAEILLLPVAGLACVAALLAAAVWPVAVGRTIPNGIQISLWLVALFPLVIATEEFCHAASCLGRGKPDRLHGLLIGRYFAGKVHLSFGFAAVDMRGRLNPIDKLCISAAGPVLTFLCVLSAWVVCRVTGAPGPLRTALLVLSAVPLVGLIPSQIIIQSDGYAVVDAFRRLGVPRAARLSELIRAVSFPLRWWFRPRRAWPDEFLSPPEAYRSIEQAVSDGDTLSAIAWYRRLLRIDPYNSVNHNNLAWLLADVQRYPEAYRHAQWARVLAPDDPDVADTWVRLRREQPKRAQAVRNTSLKEE